jgi:biofilm PGA synthesis lipoprotein PgaB
VGLLFAYVYKDIFSSLKTYYLRSYAYVFQYNLEKISKSVVYSREEEQYAESVPVLLYHGLLGGDLEAHGEATNIDLKVFWDQMRTLKNAGWQTVSMQDFYDFLQGKKKLPAKSFLLTFDDGRKDSYYPADPLLKVLDFHAVMFAIEKYSFDNNSHYYLSSAELRKMSQSKEWEIQSHGYSSHSEYPLDKNNSTAGNFFSNKLWLADKNRLETDAEYKARVRDDLLKSKEGLQNAFGKPIIAFAYPFGDYGGATVNFKKAESILVPETLSIYPMAFYQYSSVYRYTQNYPSLKYSMGNNSTSTATSTYMVARISTNPSWSGKDLLKVLEGGKAKTLPFVAKLDDTDGWKNTNWGNVELKSNTMIISALSDDTGSSVVLDGSGAWQDYTITTNVRWLKGSSIYLSGRYKDDENLVACNINKNLVHIEQIVDGESRVIAGVNNQFDPGNDQFEVKMKIKGRSVECQINGVTIVSTQFLDPALSTGGLRIKTWDAAPNNSSLLIQSLHVDPN